MTTTARLIAYHDHTCPEGTHCRDDISTYTIPPDDWKEPHDPQSAPTTHH